MILRNYPSTSHRNRIIGLMIATSSFTGIGNVNAEEQKTNTIQPVTYTKPPVSAFSSQMNDALLGSSKYEKPVWNLHDALKLPEWLSMSLEQRTRYETMDGQYKASGKGGDQGIPLQTTLALEARLGDFRVGGELMDARQLGSDSGTGINNTHVDGIDLLQAYVAWADQNTLFSGLGTELVAGRQTLNFGSRRLVTRNAFRNTINSFEALKLRVVDYDHWTLNAFVSMPVNRYPTASADILNDVYKFDRADGRTWFSGAFLEMFNLAWNVNAEAYLYHLDEGDSRLNQTRNRRYFTTGMRFYSKPAKAEFDFSLEAIGQFGTVRATTNASDGKNLSHQAWYQHLDIGYTFDTAWQPRFAVEYDYASGDKNPNDNKDQRFDTLYGARRFDYGPTGIYGAFSRTNLNTPDYRFAFSPLKDVQTTFTHRFFWLAQKTDSWGSSGLQDKTGRSGDFVGHQLEVTTRWDVNSSLNLETGWTHLFKGQFAKNAPLAPNPQDIDYFFVQSLFRF